MNSTKRLPRSSKAALIVEPDFHIHHVGVRRVIEYYSKIIQETGYEVELLVPLNGALFATRDSIAIILDSIRNVAGREKGAAEAKSVSLKLELQREPAELGSFDLTFVTNPWICARGLPRHAYDVGVVYDLAPNFIAAAIHHYDRWIDVFEFAFMHQVGFEFMAENCKNILFISESTRSDFIAYCGPSGTSTHLIDVPFEAVVPAEIPQQRRKCEEKFRVLMVNVLDRRKNFFGAVEALISVAAKYSIEVVIIGRERVERDAVEIHINKMKSSGINVIWNCDASDSVLEEAYQSADILLFPSFLEGLGLPILEAQARGLVVVSSNISSCEEFNLNPHLQVDPWDLEAIAAAVISVITCPQNQIRGHVLAQRQEAHLDGKRQFLDLLKKDKLKP